MKARNRLPTTPRAKALVRVNIGYNIENTFYWTIQYDTQNMEGLLQTHFGVVAHGFGTPSFG